MTEETAQRIAAALEEIGKLLQRLVDTIEADNSDATHARAIELWRIGQGKHPDD